MNKGSSINMTVKCPDGHPNKIDIKGEKNMANVIDPNAGKRASLTMQIKAWTGIVSQLQSQVNTWNVRIATAQLELDTLPPVPVATPVVAPVADAVKK
jgi:hypothetical protein